MAEQVVLKIDREIFDQIVEKFEEYVAADKSAGATKSKILLAGLVAVEKEDQEDVARIAGLIRNMEGIDDRIGVSIRHVKKMRAVVSGNQSGAQGMKARIAAVLAKVPDLEIETV